jgi:hypothetical protein
MSFSGFLRQSTAVEIKFGPLVDPGGDVAEVVASFAASLIRLAKNGQNWASKNEATAPANEEPSGMYRVLLDATDTDSLGMLAVVTYTGGGVRPHRQTYMVMAANVFDSLFLGTDTLDVNATSVDTGAITAASFAAAAIDANAIASNAITGAKIAANAIDASALAADAVAEIQAGLATSAEVAAVQSDTDNIQTRLPAALVSGRMDASVGAMAANTLTASALAADAVTEIAAGISIPSAATVADAVWDEARAGHVAAGSFGQGVASVVGSVGSVATGGITAGSFAASAIDAAAIASNAITAAKIATDAITAAKIAADAVAEIQSGLATASALATVQSDTDNIQTRLPAALVSGRMDASVGAMAADTLTASALAADAVTEIAAGISFPSAGTIADSVWDEARAGHVAAGSFGQGVASVVGSVGSVATGGITAGSFAAGAISEPAVASNTLTANKFASNSITAAKVAADATEEIAGAVWDELRASHVAAGSFGEGVASVQGAVTGSVASVVGAVGSIAAGGIAAASIASAAANKIADHVLRRPYGSARTSSDGDAVSFRSLLGAMGKLVNRWSISAGTLTVYQEDDSTSTAPGGTQAVTGTAGADPITQIDTT